MAEPLFSGLVDAEDGGSGRTVTRLRAAEGSWEAWLDLEDTPIYCLEGAYADS